MSALLGDLAAVLRERGLLRSIVPAATPSDVHPAGVPVVEPSIRSVSLDSRTVEPGALFAAAPGELADGHAYLPDAVEHGAVAVLVETPVTSLGVPQLVVAATRPATAVAAAWVAGFPSRHLGVVGVTGTDGKTTASYLIRSVLEAAGRPTGMAGTVDVVVGGRSFGNDARTTTPEAPALQGALARMLEAGDGWAVIEASSHGLAQDRVGEIAWDVAVLTNVTEEHLEFHRSIEAYQAAKQRLFEALAISPSNPDKGFGKTAVVNLDDPASPAFADAARTVGARVIGYGQAATAMVRLVDVNQAAERLHVEVRTPRWQGRLALRLPGRFNAHNALAAVGVGEALGLDPTVVRTALEGVAGVPGRMERIEAGQPFGVVVDYAHTADALAKVLDELAPLAAAGGGSLIVVFGSAGDRDRVKRPAMGRVAAERCRIVVVTDEDPRGEDRMAVIEAIAVGAEAAGMQRGHDLHLVPDRPTAIRRAFAEARAGDVVLLAGKGHEKTIETADGEIAWDEAREARDALRDAGWGAVG